MVVQVMPLEIRTGPFRLGWAKWLGNSRAELVSRELFLEAPSSRDGNHRRSCGWASADGPATRSRSPVREQADDWPEEELGECQVSAGQQPASAPDEPRVLKQYAGRRGLETTSRQFAPLSAGFFPRIKRWALTTPGSAHTRAPAENCPCRRQQSFLSAGGPRSGRTVGLERRGQAGPERLVRKIGQEQINERDAAVAACTCGSP